MNITGEITEALFEVTTRHSKVPAELFVVALNIVYAETLALLVVECTDEMGTDAYLDNEIEVLRKNFELAMKRKE